MNAVQLAIGVIILIFAVWVLTLTLMLSGERRRLAGETALRRRLQTRCIRLERQADANKEPETLPDTTVTFPRQLLTEHREPLTEHRELN